MQQDRLRRVNRLAHWLDSAFTVPGTHWRIGFDGLLGLIPGIGDAAAATLSGYIIYQGIRLGMPTSIIAKMIINVLFETVVGVIPVLGDLFDFAFKANERNVRLMQRYQTNPEEQIARSRFSLILILAVTLLALALVLWGAFSLLIWLLDVLANLF